eukprot:15474540-Alexandrium_andersonii.AAC.1
MPTTARPAVPWARPRLASPILTIGACLGPAGRPGCRFRAQPWPCRAAGQPEQGLRAPVPGVGAARALPTRRAGAAAQA